MEKEKINHLSEQIRHTCSVLFHSAVAAFSLYTRLPIEGIRFCEEETRYLPAFLPLVGAVLGELYLVAGYLTRKFSFPAGFAGAVFVLLPVFFTGGIHLEGYLKSQDALCSGKEPAKRLLILGRPNAGRYAVMDISVYYLVCYGAMWQILKDNGALAVMAGFFVLSRCFLSLAILRLPFSEKMDTAKYLSQQTDKARACRLLLLWFAAAVAWMAMENWLYTMIAFDICVLHFLWLKHVTVKAFGGMTEEAGGLFLCRMEMTAAFVLAVVSACMRVS